MAVALWWRWETDWYDQQNLKLLLAHGISHAIIFRQYPSLSLVLKETSHKRFISQTSSAPSNFILLPAHNRTRRQVRGSSFTIFTLSGVSDLFFHVGLISAFDNIHGQWQALWRPTPHIQIPLAWGQEKQTFRTLSTLTLVHRGDCN